MSSSYKMVGHDTQVGHPGMRHGPMRRTSDMCMVFRCKTSKHVKFDEGTQDEMMNRQLQDATKAEMNKMNMWKQRRESILKTLQNCELHLVCFYSHNRDEILVKIGATAQKLRETAARMKYKLQLKPEYLNAYAEYRHDFPGRAEMNFSDRRIVSHIYNRHGNDEFPLGDEIFTTLDKMFIIDHIVTSKDKGCAGINVGTLLHQKELQAYFPIHEQHELDDMKKNRWAWLVMHTDHAFKIREYFGDRVAFYFLWMSFYWQFMAPLAFVGILLQLIDVLAGTPDNITAVPFCIFVSIWSTFLPHFWRRQEMKFAVSWGSLDLGDSLDKCRPEHVGEPRINPATTQVEPHYPSSKRVKHYMFSSVVILFSAIMTIAIIALLLFARHMLKNYVAGGVVAFQFGLALSVEIVNSCLSKVARFLTKQENHRTQSEHELHMLAKVCGLKFLTSYSVLYWIAFFKEHGVLFGEPMACFRNDCFLDLQSQLAIFVLFRLVISNIIEMIKPRLRLWWKSYTVEGQHFCSFFSGHNKIELAAMSHAEQQYNKDPYDAFNDFDETLLTHGYATLFAVASPWVCVATMLGTILEIWLDSNRITEANRRPMPVRLKNNEPWDTAFDIYGIVAAFTNVFLLIFGSTQFNSWTFTEKLVLFLFLEHGIFGLRFVAGIIFPAMPASVALLKLKQDNIVHRCLHNIKVEHQQDFTMFRDHTKDHIEVYERDNLDPDEDEAEPQMSPLMGNWDHMKAHMQEVLAPKTAEL